jgi:hypothetical protein
LFGCSSFAVSESFTISAIFSRTKFGGGVVGRLVSARLL